MKFSRIIGASVAGLAMIAGTAAFSTAETTEASVNAAGFEEHRFSGSSTAAAAFQEWFNGGEFKEPFQQTLDLTELRVNEFETAQAGDVIYKDDQGRFWIKKSAVVK